MLSRSVIRGRQHHESSAGRGDGPRLIITPEQESELTYSQRLIPNEQDLARMLERAGMNLSRADLEAIASSFPAVSAQLERLYSYDVSRETYPFRGIFPEELQ